MHLTFSEDGLFEPRHRQLGLIVDLQAGAATLLQMPNKRKEDRTIFPDRHYSLLKRGRYTINIAVWSVVNSAPFIDHSRKKKN
jgi:hypothetical protein